MWSMGFTWVIEVIGANMNEKINGLRERLQNAEFDEDKVTPYVNMGATRRCRELWHIANEALTLLESGPKYKYATFEDYINSFAPGSYVKLETVFNAARELKEGE